MAVPVAVAQPDRPLRVLFLCTHNSARSQLAEGILRLRGGEQVDVYSAGSHPTTVHPMALALLKEHGIDTSRHSAKSLDQFAGQSFDFVITVCDRVRDRCPEFPDDPLHIHWSFLDPAMAADDGQAAGGIHRFMDAERAPGPIDEAGRRQAFQTLWLELNTRIGYLLQLPHPVTGRRLSVARASEH
ncbi:MAG TPA: arsenate reductase ArsC [Chloroflexota bacterium]|nr:arsenate reductase ArsC [Chloroflexota bacterium]